MAIVNLLCFTITFLFVALISNTFAADPILVAHRGMLRHAPENTLPAFSVCLDLGVGFELDIRTTKDGELVIIHDDKLERTTNGSNRSIRDVTLAEARKLDAGSWFHSSFKGSQIPTMEETFQLIKKRKRGTTIIALNIKQLNSQGEKKLVRLLEKYDLFEDCFAFDQSAEMSKRLKKLNPQFRIGQNVSRKVVDDRLDEDFLDVFLVTFIPTKAEVDKIREQGKQIVYNFGGTLKGRRNPSTWNKARAAGIDGMLTDYPLECRRVWRNMKP
jgi:glycerophosphoryl diester phosphodiesterase